MSLSMTRLPQRMVVTGTVRLKVGAGKRPCEGLDIHAPMLASSILSMTSLMCSADAATSMRASTDVPRQRQSVTFDDPSSTTELAAPAVSCVAPAAGAANAKSSIERRTPARMRASLRRLDDPAEGHRHVVAGLDRAEHRRGRLDAVVRHADRHAAR